VAVNAKSVGWENQVKAKSTNIPMGTYGKPSKALAKRYIDLMTLIAEFTVYVSCGGTLCFL
jgi:hypothetical protein